MKKKIANLVFNPFTHDARVLKTTTSLVNNGYIVEVIAHGNKGLSNSEERENYIVRRFSYFDRTVTKSIFSKLRIYFKYMLKSIQHCKQFDFLHCNDLNTLPIAFVIKVFYNKEVKVIYDAHEYETEVDGLRGLKKAFTKWFESFLIKYADKVINVSDAIANEYVKLYGIEKPTLVLNTPPYKKIIKKDIFRDTFNIRKEQTIFLYQGGLSTGRGIEVLLDTFKLLWDEKKKAKSCPVIVFMGYGELEEKIQEQAENYKNIYFHQAVNPDVLLDYTNSADFGISMIEDTCLSYRYCLPNKIFEYLMAEIPVIVSNRADLIECSTKEPVP